MKTIHTQPGENSKLILKVCETLEEKKEALNFSDNFKEWVKEEELEDWSCYIWEEVPCFMGDDITVFISTKHGLVIESFDNCPRERSIKSVEIKDMDDFVLEIVSK